jgi:Flp pilus assembly protein TadG
MKHQAQSSLRAPAGQSAVEFALVLPVLLLLIAGVIEFGRGYLAYAQLLQAAQEGVRYGAVLGQYRNDAAIISRVQQLSPGGLGDTVSVSATQSATNGAIVAAANRTRSNALIVSATHLYSAVIPFLPWSSLTMTAQASMVIE